MLNISLTHLFVKLTTSLINMRTASLAFGGGFVAISTLRVRHLTLYAFWGWIFSILAKIFGILFNAFEFAVTNSILHTKA